MNEFNISIIIPTYNDLELLDSTIGAIRNQSYLPEELVIVDSSDNDEIKNSLNLKEPRNLLKKNYFNSSHIGQ